MRENRLGALTIRRYLSTDREEVWNLHVVAIEAVGPLWKGPEADKLNADFQNIKGIYLANRGEFLVGLCEGRIVAMGAFRRLTDDTAEIKRMRVHPDFWRRGYGQAIYNRLEARAIELGYKKLRLDTTMQQTTAQQFYLKNGFRNKGEMMLGTFQCLLFEKDLVERR